MKTQYVRGNINQQIHRGTVTRLTGKVGIVLFDNDGGSAYFNITDGCDVGLGESDWNKGLKFVSAISIARPDLSSSQLCKRRIACYLGYNRDWVHVWAYEHEYEQALNKLMLWRHAAERSAQEVLNKLSRRDAVRKHISDLGMFRIAKAHKFTQEANMRPASPQTGPMKLVDLLNCVATKKVHYEPSSTPRSINDTLFMWFEKQTENGWVKVNITGDEGVLILDAYDGKIGLNEIQPIIDALSVRKLEAIPA